MTTLIHRLYRADPERTPRSQSLSQLALTVGLVSLYALSVMLLFAPEVLR